MGCLTVAFPALLALALPAAIARSSLGGAYVLLAVLGGLGAAGAWQAVRRRARTRPELDVRRRTAVALTRLGAVVAVYALVVSVIHLAG